MPDVTPFAAHPPAPVLAHGSGLDELAFVLLPIVIFVGLQWMSRRKQRQENAHPDTNETDGL